MAYPLGFGRGINVGQMGQMEEWEDHGLCQGCEQHGGTVMLGNKRGKREEISEEEEGNSYWRKT